MKHNKTANAVLASIALVASLVGCSAQSGSSTTTQSGGSVDLAEYQTIATAATRMATWNGPTAPAKAPQGLHVGILVCTVELEGCRLPMEGIQDAVKKLGWTQKTVVTTDPGQYSAAFKALLLDKPSIVFMVGVTQSIVADGIAQAKEAKIPVISVLGGNSPGGPKGVNAEVQPDKDAMGEAIAAKMIVDLEGRPNAIVLHDGEFDYEVTAGPTLAKCSTCTVAVTLDFTVGELQSSFPKKVVAALQANPKVNAIYLPFDPPAAFLVPALVTSGYGNIPIYSQLGTSGGLNFVRDGKSVVADIAPPEKWAGWAGVDAGIRALNGQKIESPNLPAKILTKDNLPTASQPYDGDGVDYRAKYLSLWGR